MIETEIPQSEWQVFCDQFSRQHRGWRTTIARWETAGAAVPPGEVRTRLLASELPLQDIVLEQRGEGYDLMVVAGTSLEHFTCLIHQPSQISFEQETEGEHAGLTIRDAEGRKTVVRFRVPAFPELLNDISPSEW